MHSLRELFSKAGMRRIFEETRVPANDAASDSSQLPSGNPIKQWSPPAILSKADWDDANAYNDALYVDGDIRRPRRWHKASMDPILEDLLPYIKDGDIGLDLATGTGGSAIELLKALQERGIRIHLITTDVKESWFAKAHELLEPWREDVEFQSLKDEEGRWRTIPQILAGRKANFVLSQSTLHLLTENALRRTMQGIYDGLADDGVFVFGSGDFGPAGGVAPKNAVLLHSPYRKMRRTAVQELRRLYGDEWEPPDEAKANNIFLKDPHPRVTLLKAIHATPLRGSIYAKINPMPISESKIFISVPSLWEYIPRDYAQAHPNMAADLLGRQYLPLDPRDPNQYMTYWTYGVYGKGKAGQRWYQIWRRSVHLLREIFGLAAHGAWIASNSAKIDRGSRTIRLFNTAA